MKRSHLSFLSVSTTGLCALLFVHDNVCLCSTCLVYLVPGVGGRGLRVVLDGVVVLGEHAALLVVGGHLNVGGALGAAAGAASGERGNSVEMKING